MCFCVCVFGVRVCVALCVVIVAPLTRFGLTMGRMHYDSEPLKIDTLEIRPLTRSLAPLTRLFHTARFARAPLRSFARSLAVLNHSGMTMKSTS